MRTHPRSLLALALLLPSAAALQAQGQVWVVAPAPGPGVDATTVDAALALAGDGDLILVRGAGLATFPPFTVDGLAVTIQGDPSATILADAADPAVTIQNLAPGRSVTLNTLAIRRVAGAGPPLRIRDNQGPVLLDAVSVDGLGAGAVEVADSVSVAFEGCLLSAGPLTPTGPEPAGPGPADAATLDVSRSSVFFDQGAVGGPSGFDAFESGGEVVAPGDGGLAVRLRGASLTLSAGEIVGGAGGKVVVGCVPGGDGGDAIVADADRGIPSFVRRTEGLVTGGIGGFAFTGCSSPGTKGEAITLVAGTLEELPQTVRYLIPEPLAQPAATVELLLLGQVGDAAFLVVGQAPMPGLFLPGLDLVAHVTPAAILPLGTLAQLIEKRTLATPSLPAGFGFAGFTLQALYVGGGEAFLTGPSGLSILP